MNLYHVAFIILLNPWVVLGLLALSVWLYSGPPPEPTDAEVKAYQDKVAKELRARR